MADSLIEFVGMFFAKGSEHNCEDFDDYIWEKPWNDNEITEDVKSSTQNSDSVPKIQEVWEAFENKVRFKVDCFAMKMNSIIPLSPTTLQSGMEDVIENIGVEETFKDFREDLIKLGLEQYNKLKQRPEPEKFTLENIEMELIETIKDFYIIRLLTVWSYSIYGREEPDEEWNLIGTLDHNKISELIITKNKYNHKG